MDSHLTSFELEIRDIDLTLEKIYEKQSALESLINNTKSIGKNKKLEKSKIVDARKILRELNEHIAYLNQRRQQIIRDMSTHEFLLWADDQGPGYWG